MDLSKSLLVLVAGAAFALTACEDAPGGTINTSAVVPPAPPAPGQGAAGPAPRLVVRGFIMMGALKIRS